MDHTIKGMKQLRHMSRLAGRRRVVVTGMGLVTCLGIGTEYVWNRLIQGHCGIQKLEDPAFKDIPSKVAGIVPRGNGEGQLSLENYVSKADQRSMSLAACYALVAAEEALQQAAWSAETETQQSRTGVAVGMGMSSMADIVDAGETLVERGYRRISPHFIPKILTNMAAGQISLRHKLKGVNHAVSTACTTGAHAIGDGMRFIEHGDADVMVCGGTEASVIPVAVAGFARMRALATSYNDEPGLASRPFDEDREGFVMSEGAGVLVLEELEHAQSRGANIYAEILGYGLSGDANHITAPSDNGDGAYRCMKAALDDSGIIPDQIGYLNAHATSTPLGDAAECTAIHNLMKNCSHEVTVSSTKGAVGHLLGAAGSVEAIFTIMACNTGCLPPTLNCVKPDTGFRFNFVPSSSQQWRNTTGKRVALTNSFGFGGTNASLCIGEMI